ncbi:hypothetical protein NDU88_005199 [Pleurodeles waltl]|uniref:Uncharacterized protein n=1 Tax=Pleurodeles waltl TaxID=8319 RepID=A0AAV7SL52_PLEWA|nr:hypothetical protein NDU88_005199 [Pleurodeles waltl]
MQIPQAPMEHQKMMLTQQITGNSSRECLDLTGKEVGLLKGVEPIKVTLKPNAVFPQLPQYNMAQDVLMKVAQIIADFVKQLRIHASHTKKVACPVDHEEALLRVPTTVRQITAPEQEKKQGGTEAEPQLIEDGSITPVRDKGGDLQEGAGEPISTDEAGEPSTEGPLPEADDSERQTAQVPDPEGEGVELDQSQSDPTPPEPDAGSRKGDKWPESQVEKRKEVFVDQTIEEEVDTMRKEELSEGELNGDWKLKRKRTASRRYAGAEWAYATTNESQQEFMGVIMTPAVGVIVAVVPPTGWRYILPYYDNGSLAKAKLPMYHTDRHSGNDRRAGDYSLQPGSLH